MRGYHVYSEATAGEGLLCECELGTRRTVSVMPSASCGKIFYVDIGRQEVHTLGIGTGNARTSRTSPGLTHCPTSCRTNIHFEKHFTRLIFMVLLHPRIPRKFPHRKITVNHNLCPWDGRACQRDAFQSTIFASILKLARGHQPVCQACQKLWCPNQWSGPRSSNRTGILYSIRVLKLQLLSSQSEPRSKSQTLMHIRRWIWCQACTVYLEIFVVKIFSWLPYTTKMLFYTSE